MNSTNCLAIMAILAEMVRRVNENIAKVDLKPMPVALTEGGTIKRVAASKGKKA
jgi:hypothetical protein